MNRVAPILQAREIERRAAEIRRQWSVAERIRRTSLPPDMPICLRQWSNIARIGRDSIRERKPPRSTAAGCIFP
jgi:hypothetical protein